MEKRRRRKGVQEEHNALNTTKEEGKKSKYRWPMTPLVLEGGKRGRFDDSDSVHLVCKEGKKRGRMSSVTSLGSEKKKK